MGFIKFNISNYSNEQCSELFISNLLKERKKQQQSIDFKNSSNLSMSDAIWLDY